ncbi:alpha/beta fold hydrolase [Corynebacterium sp. A21]|uniref:alpha/beta fold hydrolase n=1 Tax=Corynebacterium sp. A21 TaxID=3457318 RepID=UPI003FD18F3B
MKDEVMVVEVGLPAGATSPVLLHPGADRPLVMLWPGFGMGARYYRPIAGELAARGFPVAVGELRGQGASTARASRSAAWGYHDLAAVDYPRAIRAAKTSLGLPMDHPTVLLTHSMGGQIGALFLSRPEATELNVRGMFGVGSGSPQLVAFPKPMRRRLWLGTVLLGTVGGFLGFWPGKVLGWDPVGYGRQSGTHMWEWRQLAHRNTFAGLTGADLDYPAALAQVTAPIQLCYFRNDLDCPRPSAQALAEQLPSADLLIEELAGDLGHNRWARQPQIVAARFERFVAEKL